MKKRLFLFSLLLLILVSCRKKSGADHYEGDKVMKWTDEYFIQICSQVFNKPANHITYKDVSAIEKIMYVVINGEEKISVFLSNNPEAKLINRPNSTIKSIEDLIYFKNLQYFEIFEENILGIEVLQDMPQLKTLVLRGRVNIKMIKKIAKYSHLESLTMPYFNIDYSCLTQLSTLKNLVITTPFNGVTLDINTLQSLPNEGCLLDLGFINAENLTSELYTFLNSHTNISNIGFLYVPDGCDLSFFKNMKNLNKVEIRGSSLDLTGISQMFWLKELIIWGNDIDISQLSELIYLERLDMKEEGGANNNLYPLSIDILKNHKYLQSLSLQGYMIENLNGLEVFSNLISFSGKGCFIEDISALKALSNLEFLDLNDNLIIDISVIQYLTKLKNLNLNSNEISNISPLKNCINLECLKINNNYIEDISPLKNLQKLEELQIENNFHIENNDFYTEADKELIVWRNTLLSLPNLKFYVGGPPIGESGESDRDWIKKHLPKVKYGYRDIVG